MSEAKQNFRVRFLLPQESQWFEIVASSVGQAANDVHDLHFFSFKGIHFLHEFEEGKNEDIYFARVEVEGHGVFISRLYRRGIRRRGVRYQTPTLTDIAKTLGWKHPPGELVAPGWEEEQSEWGR